MPYKEIKVKFEDKICTISLDVPDKMNPLSLSMTREILEVIDKAQSEARVLILTATGRAFCSGTNLSAERMGDLQKGDIGIALEEIYNPLFVALRNSKIPVICAINGAAVGIGCPLALMGDIIIAAKSSYFMQGFLNIGLIPDGGSAYVLSRAIGRVKAMEMMLLGNKIYSEEALARGLVTQICEDDELMNIANAIALKLTKAPKFAVELMRKSAWAALDNDYLNQLSLERNLQKDAGNHKDFIEGVTAFMQKREPKFGE